MLRQNQTLIFPPNIWLLALKKGLNVLSKEKWLEESGENKKVILNLFDAF